MSRYWLEVRGNPTVGWAEEVDDPLPPAAEAAAELRKPVSIHQPGCGRGKGWDPFLESACTCTPTIVQPGARA